MVECAARCTTDAPEPSPARGVWMTIEALTGVLAVSLVVALICHLCPPPDGGSGPGGNAL
jgi:hypothetical protein